jgi:glycine oxidase
MPTADALIIGGGIIGLSIARELVYRGLKVALLERNQPGREASWAGAGMLAPQGELSEGDFLRLCLESNRLYPAFRTAIEDETGITCYHREAGTLALALTADDERDLRRTYEQQLADRLQVEWMTAGEARGLEPSLSEAVRAAMYLPGDRHIENRLLVPALEQACRKLGVEIVSGAQVIRITVADGHVSRVETVLGAWHSPVVINAAGAWAEQIGVPDEALRPPVFPVLGQMLAITLPDPGFLTRVVRSPRSYLVPRHDGRLFLGATMERVGFHKRNTVWGIHKLLTGAVELLPGLEHCSIQETWCGLRPGTPDNHPILGATALPGYFMATGTFRNGLLLTPVIAQSMADLVTTGRTPEIIAPFALQRFAHGEVKEARLPGA